MQIKQITDLGEFATLLPKLSELRKQRPECFWDPLCSDDKLKKDLLALFSLGFKAYSEEREGQLLYFIMEAPFGTEKCFAVLFVNTEIRVESKDLIRTAIKLADATVYFKTTKMTTSYRRWIGKFGAKQNAVIFVVEKE